MLLVDRAALSTAGELTRLLISLLFLVGGGIFWLYDRAREDDAAGVKAQETEPVASTEVVATAPDAKSIAVLPFADMSPAKDQEYMSDGIAEELLNRLARVPDLKVIARTSSFAFKGQNISAIRIKADMGLIDTMEASERDRRLKRHALEVSPNLPCALYFRCVLDFEPDSTDWVAAEGGLKRALELDPTCVEARNTAGMLYMGLGRQMTQNSSFERHWFGILSIHI